MNFSALSFPAGAGLEGEKKGKFGNRGTSQRKKRKGDSAFLL